MKVGSLNQKASWSMVAFVFGCIFIIIFLLYIKVRAESKAEVLLYDGKLYTYLDQ